MDKFYFIRAYVLYIIFLVFHFQPSYTQEGKYHIQNFTPIDYKAGIQNIDFAQNRDMSIFVANNLGVLSFNGNEWKVHAFKNGKKQRSLAFDENKNRLYVGAQGEFGYFYDDWSYKSLIGLIPDALKDFDEVWDVYIIDSKVYFCTIQGIYIYDGHSITVIESQDGFDRSFQINGTLFTQSKNGKLFEIKGLNLIPTHTQNHNKQIIASVIPKKDGYILFYNSGQIEFSSSEETSKFDPLITMLRGTYVNHVLQMSDTRLAISTQTSGLFLYDIQKQSIEQISSDNGLQSNACLRAFQDYTGNLWIGMQSGIALVHNNSPIRLINEEINLQGSGYEAYETIHGTYYSTTNGIYFLENNASQAKFLEGTEGPGYAIQEIAGKLYAGHHSGLFRLEGAEALRIATTNGLWQIKQLRSKPEFAIAGTYSGLHLFKIDANQNIKPIRKLNGFEESSRFFEEDNQGNIIVSQYYKGLYELHLKDDLTNLDTKILSDNNSSTPYEQIILEKIENELYIGTNQGLYKIDQEKDSIVSDDIMSDVIGKQAVYLIKQDNLKNIHVITENTAGYFKQISSNNYVFIPSTLYQLRYYLNNDLLNCSVNINSGILFSANEGFLRYNHALEDRIEIAQPLLISKVNSPTQDTILFNLQPFEPKPEKEVSLSFKQSAKVLQFDIESYQFQNINNQFFRYYLQGYDDQYSEWSNRTTKEYTNLSEGKYELHVQTKNYLGKITQSQTLLLTVTPPLYRSLFAKVLYLLMALIAFYLLYRFQKEKHNKQAKAIEEKNLKELAEKEQKLLKIEERKEKELLQLEEAKIESELRHLNNLLAASTMNLVVKNEFIENIKKELKDVRLKGNNVRTNKSLENIEKEIDITLRLQEDWEQFEYHFDKVHGDFLTRLKDEFLDLTPNDHKLCAFLRLNLNTKEIANLMSISLRGVEVARYRLRQKLHLHRGMNLSKFILEY